MKMKNLGLALFLLVEVCYGTGGPQKLPFAELDSLLRVGIDLTLRQEYDSAMQVFRNAAQSYPHHPAGPLYQMAVLQAMAMDYEEVIGDGGFDSLLSMATMKSQSMIERDPGSPWGYYFLGSALGHDSYARAQRGDWFGTITKGLSAVSQFEETVKRDSLFYDAFLGMGTYFYWKTRKIEFLTWLPFIRDDRERGIRLLQRCADGGEYNKYGAMSALLSIYIDAGEDAKADSISSRCLAQYPQNRIFLWGKATALDRKGATAEALRAYEALLGAITTDKRQNPYNELVCRLRLSIYLVKADRVKEAEQHLKTLLKIPQEAFSERLRSRAEEKVQEAKELVEEIAVRKNASR